MCLTQPCGWKRVNAVVSARVRRRRVSLLARTGDVLDSALLHFIPNRLLQCVNTYSERFGKPGAEVVEDYGDDVLVRDVHVARLEVHFPGSHQIQGILKRHLWDLNKTISK